MALRQAQGAGPRVVAVIPARGGSKGVPGKNLRRVGGRSLVERAVDACRSARLVDAVYVSTDDPYVARAATAAGALVIDRPADLAGDTASSESALLHALDHLDRTGGSPETLVFVQCTSPFIAADDLDRGIRLVSEGSADSAFSGVATYEFLWRKSRRSGVDGQNHDPRMRPRRQDRAPDFRETGAFYVMAVDGFRAARHRFFGRTEVVEVSELTAVDIDHEHDVMLATALAEVLDPVVQIEVDVVITDFDGVHTDDSVLVDQDGHESVRVSRSDGLGVEMLRTAGVPVLIVSKEANPVVRARARKLGVGVLHSVERKGPVVRDWLAANGIPPDRAAYLGNDINDLGPMGVVGWPVAVADAHPAVRRAARLVLNRFGGDGAVRELCDLVLVGRTASPPPERPAEVGAALSSVGTRQVAPGGGAARRPARRPGGR